jgi:hypothetical protein
MTHRRRDRPCRVTVDSLSTDTRFAFRSLRTVHLGVASSHGYGILNGLAGTEDRGYLTAVPWPGRWLRFESP